MMRSCSSSSCLGGTAIHRFRPLGDPLLSGRGGGGGCGSGGNISRNNLTTLAKLASTARTIPTTNHSSDCSNHWNCYCRHINTESRFKFSTTSNQPRKVSSSFDFLESASEYFGALRWKAANALTASLSTTEREQLLQDLYPERFVPKENPQKEDQDEEKQTDAPSIAEAVAAARAKDAQAEREKWEREKENIMAQAEEAARARVENDLLLQKRKLAFEAWKRDLERKNNQESMPTTTTTTTSTAMAPESTVDTPSQQPQQLEESDLSSSIHPILGPALVDLGHKRIHLVSAQALASMPVWKKQRAYRHERAKTMAKDKMKSLYLGLPGVITLFESNDGSLSILDGQHRVGMLKVLQERDIASTAAAMPSTIDFDRVLVEVFPQQDDASVTFQAQELFLEINKAEPVKLVDLPGIAKKSQRTLISNGATKLAEDFPDMFSASQRCRAPHLNIDNLRDSLFAANILERHKLKNSKALVDWMMDQNNKLAVKFQQDESNTTSVSAAALKKAQAHGFYLGLDPSWYYW